jgi:3-oxoacyl-[acyl-carrier-protein] synthase-3
VTAVAAGLTKQSPGATPAVAGDTPEPEAATPTDGRGPDQRRTSLAAIAGVGSCVPDRRVTNFDLEATMDTSDAWIFERTGIRERRVATPEQATSDLAVPAARAALADAGMDPADIGICLVATCTPDTFMPSTAAFVGEALGLRCGGFDLNAACSGFVYGLITAAAMVAGGCGPALVIGAEIMSRWIDFSDRSTGILFGDGAGAVVLVPSQTSARTPADEPGREPGLLAWDMGSDPTAAGILGIPAGGSRLPASPETLAANQHIIRMEGREVFRRAVRVVVDSIALTLDKAGVKASDVSLFVPHQANSRIVDAVLPRLGLTPDQTLMNIDRYGNTSAASIPLALAEATDAGRLAAGDLVLMTGFGAGMTWATALVRWGRP